MSYDMWQQARKEMCYWRAAFVACLVLFLFTNISWIILYQEFPQDAYERGYEDARSVLLDTLYNRWLNDSVGWHLYFNVDSTDTMPVMEMEGVEVRGD